jgi:hypothetical protein
MKYQPVNVYYDKDLKEEVTVYLVHSRKFHVSGSGIQQVFLDNNARVDEDGQYGFKLIQSKVYCGLFDIGQVQAKAAYDRQKRAWEDVQGGPPTYGMVKFVVHSSTDPDAVDGFEIYWGYATGIADMDNNRCEYDSEELADLYHEYEGAVDNYNQAISDLQSAADDLDHLGIAADVPCEIDCMDFEDWCEENGYELPENPLHSGELDEVMDLSRQGLQHDLKPLGYKYHQDRGFRGDLHRNNIGYYGGRAVIIDFGTNLVS